jgi:hypothetical protein
MCRRELVTVETVLDVLASLNLPLRRFGTVHEIKLLTPPVGFPVALEYFFRQFWKVLEDGYWGLHSLTLEKQALYFRFELVQV